MATYEGWKNWETWVVNLWLSNEEPNYRYWSEVSMDIFLEGGGAPVFKRTVKKLAARLEEDLMDSIFDGKTFDKLPGYARDMLGTSLRDVDWEEIAEHWMGAAKEEYDRRR
jgi:hypothetical protein